MKKTILSFVVLSGLLIPYLSFAQTAGTLSFTVTPVEHSGNWGLKNVLAIWIQNSSDDFIRTEFRYWGGGTNDHLPNWKANSNENTTDATTGATLTSYTTKTFTWDGTDLSGTVVPDGDYKVTIEECWSHGSSNVTKSFTFTKNDTESHLTPDDDADFINVALDWVPLTTGIVTFENSNEFSVFPNPTHDKINIDFRGNTQACNIYIVNILGQEVYSEQENQAYSGVKSIDLTGFTKGIYFVKVEMNSKIQSTMIELIK
jgi:flagellar hook assembly protein FlgD